MLLLHLLYPRGARPDVLVETDPLVIQLLAQRCQQLLQVLQGLGVQSQVYELFLEALREGVLQLLYRACLRLFL